MAGEVQNNSGTTTSISTRPSTNAKSPAELEKQIKVQLEERKKSIEARLTTSNKNISSTEDEINQLESKTLVGIFARMSGQKGVLEEQIKDEKRFRAKIENERVAFNKTSEKVEKLLKEGKTEEAKAVLDGREAEYKKNIKSASSRLATGYKQANEDLKDVDNFLANREQDIDKAHTRLVILASLLSFGKGKAIITTAKATAFGLTVGLSSNLAEGLANTFQYGQSGKESSKTAALKTGKDAWTSFKVGATAGLGKVIGGLKSLAALPTTVKAFISGSAVSAASSATDTTVGTISGEDKRTKTQKGVDFIKDTIIGGLSSMLGLKGEQWQQGKSAVTSTIIRGTTDVVAPGALNYAAGNAANKATGREAQTPDQVLDSTLDSTTSTLVGAHTKSSAQSNNSQPTPQTPKPASLPPLPSPLPPPPPPPPRPPATQPTTPSPLPPPPPPKPAQPASTQPAKPSSPLPPPPPPPPSQPTQPGSTQAAKPSIPPPPPKPPGSQTNQGAQTQNQTTPLPSQLPGKPPLSPPSSQIAPNPAIPAPPPPPPKPSTTTQSKKTKRHFLEQANELRRRNKQEEIAIDKLTPNVKGVRHVGWKIHLNVDDNPTLAKEIDDYLESKNINHKIGGSGEQKGKGATIYIGSRDQLERIAHDLHTKFGHRIPPAIGDVLNNDVQIVGGIWARFDPDGQGFNQYGFNGKNKELNGISFLHKDYLDIAKKKNSGWDKQHPKEFAELQELYATRAHNHLVKGFGRFYYGSKKSDEEVLKPILKPTNPVVRSFQSRLSKLSLILSQQLKGKNYIIETDHNLDYDSKPTVSIHPKSKVIIVKISLKAELELENFSSTNASSIETAKEIISMIENAS